VIHHLPEILSLKDKNGEVHIRNINVEWELDNVVCSAISSVQPFLIHSCYTAGSQKTIKGHFSLSSVDQSHVGGALNKYRSTTDGKNIYAVLCSRMTPALRNIVQSHAEMDTDLFMDLLTWFPKVSGHMDYSGVIPLDECPNPIIILQDDDNENNTDQSIDAGVECKIQGKKYYFSSGAQNPTTDNSVFDST